MEDIRHFYKFRPDEIFRRVTVTSLVTLMLEVSKLEYQQEDSEKLATQIHEDQSSLAVTPITIVPSDEEVNIAAVNGHVEEVDECDNDSLDSAIDPEEEKEEIDDGMIDSIAFKGKRIKKGCGLNSHHHSSVGDLLQVRRAILSNIHTILIKHVVMRDLKSEPCFFRELEKSL
jgi:hypothetical protein